MSDAELPMRFESAHSVPKLFKFVHVVTSFQIMTTHLRRLDCLNIKTLSHAQSHSLQVVSIQTKDHTSNVVGVSYGERK